MSVNMHCGSEPGQKNPARALPFVSASARLRPWSCDADRPLVAVVALAADRALAGFMAVLARRRRPSFVRRCRAAARLWMWGRSRGGRPGGHSRRHTGRRLEAVASPATASAPPRRCPLRCSRVWRALTMNTVAAVSTPHITVGRPSRMSGRGGQQGQRGHDGAGRGELAGALQHPARRDADRRLDDGRVLMIGTGTAFKARYPVFRS